MDQWAIYRLDDAANQIEPNTVALERNSKRVCLDKVAVQRAVSYEDWDIVERNVFIEAELGPLRSYALALCRDPDDAEELVQDTVLKTLSNWTQWRGDGNRAAWMFTIMRNRFRECLRRRRPLDVSVTEIDDAHLVDVQQSVESNLHLADVDAALGQLSAAQRETLILASIDGLTYAQIAERTQVPVGTIMSRLSRARARLGNLIGETAGAHPQPTSSKSNVHPRS